jgi:hypothetical protein
MKINSFLWVWVSMFAVAGGGCRPAATSPSPPADTAGADAPAQITAWAPASEPHREPADNDLERRELLRQAHEQERYARTQQSAIQVAVELVQVLDIGALARITAWSAAGDEAGRALGAGPDLVFLTDLPPGLKGGDRWSGPVWPTGSMNLGGRQTVGRFTASPDEAGPYRFFD